MLQSTQYKRAVDHIGKKVVVVGAGTSGMRLFRGNSTYHIQLSCAAHDIAADCYKHGVGALPLTKIQFGYDDKIQM